MVLTFKLLLLINYLNRMYGYNRNEKRFAPSSSHFVLVTSGSQQPDSHWLTCFQPRLPLDVSVCRPVTDTTRPRRDCEVSGRDYHLTCLSVCHHVTDTTRPRRDCEVSGRDYHLTCLCVTLSQTRRGPAGTASCPAETTT